MSAMLACHIYIKLAGTVLLDFQGVGDEHDTEWQISQSSIA